MVEREIFLFIIINITEICIYLAVIRVLSTKG